MLNAQKKSTNGNFSKLCKAMQVPYTIHFINATIFPCRISILTGAFYLCISCRGITLKLMNTHEQDECHSFNNNYCYTESATFTNSSLPSLKCLHMQLLTNAWWDKESIQVQNTASNFSTNWYWIRADISILVLTSIWDIWLLIKLVPDCCAEM